MHFIMPAPGMDEAENYEGKLKEWYHHIVAAERVMWGQLANVSGVQATDSLPVTAGTEASQAVDSRPGTLETEAGLMDSLVHAPAAACYSLLQALSLNTLAFVPSCCAALPLLCRSLHMTSALLAAHKAT